MTDREAYITLNMIQGIGPVSVASLVAALGSPAAILKAGRQELEGVRGIGKETASKILEQRERIDPAKEIAAAATQGVTILTRDDSDYPRRLREIHDPPLALYVKGKLVGGESCIAVVGTRHATHYGRDCAERLAYQLVQAGFTVSSGLALGVDTAAHKGALKAGGRTIGVVGCGIDIVYPPENKELADDISASGAVVSEFPLGRQPDRTTFAIRNRVVSGMSMGIIVVEAGTTSGALITARQALEQGRSVFAVPGRIDSPASRGTHELLRGGARLVEDIEDVLAEFEFLIPPRNMAKGAEREGPMPKLSPEESRLIEVLSNGAMDVDSLIRESGLDPAKVSSLLIGLEMKKLARMLPGRQVELVRRHSA
ncbi:MAG: DNA-processing protein DprA [bacterium]